MDVEYENENEFCIILPDFTSEQLEGLVDIMHSGLLSNYIICIIMLMKYARGGGGLPIKDASKCVHFSALPNILKIVNNGFMYKAFSIQ